jgi:hypothetical protein
MWIAFRQTCNAFLRLSWHEQWHHLYQMPLNSPLQMRGQRAGVPALRAAVVRRCLYPLVEPAAERPVR